MKIFCSLFCDKLYSLHQLSPLHIAAGQGDLDKVKTLIDKGADINIKDPGSGVSMCDSSISTTDLSLQTPKKGTLFFQS